MIRHCKFWSCVSKWQYTFILQGLMFQRHMWSIRIDKAFSKDASLDTMLDSLIIMLAQQPNRLFNIINSLLVDERLLRHCTITVTVAVILTILCQRFVFGLSTKGYTSRRVSKKLWPGDGIMLGRHRRCWTNFTPTPAQKWVLEAIRFFLY